MQHKNQIISFYASDMNGVVGYAMYNKYGIYAHQEKPIVINTRQWKQLLKI